MVNEQFPLLNHKPALMRAFQATLRAGRDRSGRFPLPFFANLWKVFQFAGTQVLQCTLPYFSKAGSSFQLGVPERAGNGDEWVQKHEFKMLLGRAPGHSPKAFVAYCTLS